uniref:C-type lectin domain-containing protein n=1 Tax=Denticeps clupeoides TaxID=299321 RepID=A0AAY4D503_9TELE
LLFNQSILNVYFPKNLNNNVSISANLAELWILRCFYLTNFAMDWLTARNYCRSKYDDLATVKSLTGNTAMTSLAQNKKVWFGLNNRWQWSDNTDLNIQKPKNGNGSSAFKCAFAGRTVSIRPLI